MELGAAELAAGTRAALEIRTDPALGGKLALSTFAFRLSTYQKNGSDCAIGNSAARQAAMPPRYHMTLV